LEQEQWATELRTLLHKAVLLVKLIDISEKSLEKGMATIASQP
jgi:hypothetical protein